MSKVIEQSSVSTEVARPLGVGPLRVAIIGSGPAGFYAAEALLKQTEPVVHVDIFDRLPTPFGLVRGGVAPDHPKIKGVARVFERTAQRPAFRFYGNVRLGKDIWLADLREHYHLVILAVGNEADRRMGVPGEGITGSTPAAVFVGWYNGHPDYRAARIRLDVPAAAVVGNGNVAVDVARILLRSPEGLAKTDIASHALQALEQSAVRDVYLLGRRGPAQAAFTAAELRELAELDDVDIVLDPAVLDLDPASAAAVAADSGKKQVLQVLQALAERPLVGRPRRLHMRFWVSPLAVEAGADDAVAGLRLEKNRPEARSDGQVAAKGTGEHETLPVGLVVPAIGYAGDPIEGIPFDSKALRIPSRDGRVVDPATGEAVPHLYVVGWARTGPQGLIGAHKASSAEVVQRALEDAVHDGLAARTLPPPEALLALLASRQVQHVSFDDWQRLDAIEVARGERRGAPRDKFSDVEAILRALG